MRKTIFLVTVLVILFPLAFLIRMVLLKMPFTA